MTKELMYLSLKQRRRVFSYLVSLVLHLSTFSVHAQQVFSLNDVINLAQSQSPYYHRAKNTYQKSYWQFANFKSNFKPQLRLKGTVPTFYRAFNPVIQPDGSIQFIRVSQANNSVGLSIQQNIGFTGGTLIAGTNLQRTDNFSGQQSNYFLSTPIQLSYIQNSLLFNSFSWQKKLEPLLFEKAKKTFTENMEQASFEVIQLFLQTITAQVDVEIATSNKAIADTLHRLSRERFRIGTIPHTDLLQLELNLLKATSQLSDYTLNKEGKLRSLKRILGFSASDTFDLQMPQLPTLINISYEKALEEARSNRSDMINYSVERIQADQQIAKAQGQNSLEFSLTANLGTQQTSGKLWNSYQNLQNQQFVGVTVDIPIQDWGYRRSQIKLAKSNRDLIEVNMNQEEQAFEQEIFIQVLQFNRNFSQLETAQKADTLAQHRLGITKERYLLGKLSIPDLNLALQESVDAKRAYIQALCSYWLSYYRIRSLTLYDFAQNEEIVYENN